MKQDSRNIKIILAYDGTHYAGFQRQNNGPTIQAEVEGLLSKITTEKITIHGAGRTDAGVHAWGQVINFNTASLIPAEKFQKALNAMLSSDIIARNVAEVPLDFHARYSAKSKTYSYRIYNQPLPPLFERNFVYHYKLPLDIVKMKAAIQLLIGKHDFKSFQATGSAVKTTVRTINFCKLTQKGPELRLEINADGFLYHMVRNIVGTLILVGNGRLKPDGFEAIIMAKDRNTAGPTVSAQGLCLDEVIYEDDVRGDHES